MKQLIAIGLLVFVLGCKKNKTQPTQNPTSNVCETKTKVFEGKYETQSDSKDTITIVFIHNNCPIQGVNTYSVYGLGKAYNNATHSSLDINKVYEIRSDEASNSATTNGVVCNWGAGTILSCNYSGIGPITFKKL